jgi:hypothetical protein
MKLISTELNGEAIQVTYTDGQPEDSAKSLLVYRQPYDGDDHRTIAWNQLRAISNLIEWASKERSRLVNEIESR